jgi:hypothetical protein
MGYTGFIILILTAYVILHVYRYVLHLHDDVITVTTVHPHSTGNAHKLKGRLDLGETNVGYA